MPETSIDDIIVALFDVKLYAFNDDNAVLLFAVKLYALTSYMPELLALKFIIS